MNEKILILDDEEPILEIMSLILKKKGCEVACFQSGEKALKNFRHEYERGSPYTIAILDASIPGGAGARDLISPMKERDSLIKVIITSGDSVDRAILDPSSYGFSAALRKPFHSADIDAAIIEANLNASR